MPSSSPVTAHRSCASSALHDRLRRIDEKAWSPDCRSWSKTGVAHRVLTQVQAVQAALDSVALSLVEEHVRMHVFRDRGPDAGDGDSAELMRAVARLLQRSRRGGCRD